MSCTAAARLGLGMQPSSPALLAGTIGGCRLQSAAHITHKHCSSFMVNNLQDVTKEAGVDLSAIQHSKQGKACSSGHPAWVPPCVDKIMIHSQALL